MDLFYLSSGSEINDHGKENSKKGNRSYSQWEAALRQGQVCHLKQVILKVLKSYMTTCKGKKLDPYLTPFKN
jgi:hypothetical protein